MTFVYMNDRFMEHGAAMVPVTDRGFLFGDGVFDTLRVRAGTPYRWGWHMDRFRRGIEAIRIKPPQDLRSACEELLKKNKVTDGLLRIYVTRGSGGSGYLPAKGNTPTLMIETRPLPDTAMPLKLWLSGTEKISTRALPVAYKLAAQGLNATLARLEAEDNGGGEALQLTHEGHISEATSASIFWLKGDTLYTPSLECGCLEGGIRARLIELFDVKEGRYEPQALKDADAVFLTSASRLAQPVEALMPQGWRWPMSERVAGIAERLKNDVSDYCGTRPWS